MAFRTEKFKFSRAGKVFRPIAVIISAITGYNAIQVYEWHKKQWRDYQFDWVIYAYCCFKDRTEIFHVVENDGGISLAFGRDYVPYILRFPGQKLAIE